MRGLAPREHFNRACALLDLIGSGDPDQPTEAQVDLREHRRALMGALDVVLLVARADMEEADVVDAERAKRDEALKRKATTRRVLARASSPRPSKTKWTTCYSRVVMRRSNVPANAWKAPRWRALSQRRRCARSHSLRAKLRRCLCTARGERCGSTSMISRVR